MRLKELQGALQNLSSFEEPFLKWEQYPTSPHIAAHMLHTIHERFEEIEGKCILDLGCGPGILGIGAALLGARFVIGVDIDCKVLKIAKKNCKDMDVRMELICLEVEKLQLDSIPSDYSTNQDDDESVEDEDDSEDEDDVSEEKKEEKSDSVEKDQNDEGVLSIQTPSTGQRIDTVIMNPPFGTKKKGIDMIFLQKALEVPSPFSFLRSKLSSVSVYSLHKSSTRMHLEKKAKEWGVEMKVLAELRWDIPQMYKFHKQKSVDIEVDFIRFDSSKYKK